MSQSAKWKNKTWGVSSKQIKSIKDLAFEYQQKSDNNTSAEGSPPTNVRGLEPFSLTFTTDLHANAGVNIRNEIDSWKALISEIDFFYLEGKPLGPKVKLTKVGVSNVKLDDLGRMRTASLEFEFKEDTTDTDTDNTAKKDASAKNTAADVGASNTDKAQKKPDNAQASAAPAKQISVGDYVKVMGTKYFTGETIPDWVKNQSHVVSRISGEKTLLGHPDGINSWVYSNQVSLK